MIFDAWDGQTEEYVVINPQSLERLPDESVKTRTGPGDKRTRDSSGAKDHQNAAKTAYG